MPHVQNQKKDLFKNKRYTKTAIPKNKYGTNLDIYVDSLDVQDNHQRVSCEELRSVEEYNIFHTHNTFESIRRSMPRHWIEIEATMCERHIVR
ncbi:MAG: hypothetical protein JNL11_07575 [Bdellovibrionaceae bacterium]|nr:hypothetical protein [Pseudobdellovibrionaceae bacterium]